MGLFATAFFAIPVGVLASAFEADFGLDDDDEEDEVRCSEINILIWYEVGLMHRDVSEAEVRW